MTIHPTWEDQIALLLTKKFTIPAKYANFANVFSKELAKVLSKRIRIKIYAIELEEGGQAPYRQIYSIGPIELKIFKTYIKTNLIHGFIRPSKWPIHAPFLFVCKPNGNFSLCIN